MERFSQRESILLGYTTLQRSSPKAPFRNSDVDFNDVFGGPPRRFSMQEVCYSFGDANESLDDSKGNDEPWSGSGEKPVFGDEGLNRRRYASSDFFDDIFGGDSSVTSTPKRHGREYPFPSSPGSRVLSPLPPKAEPFGGSSLLSQFSLPPKVSKGVDLPTFGPPARSPYRYEDGASNGISYSYSPGTSLTRFSSEAIQGNEGSRNDIRSSYRLSPLSQDFPQSSEVSSNLTESDRKDKGTNLKRDSGSSENSTNSGHFHFSIYKWASKGVPLDIPLRGRSSPRSKDTAKSDEPLSGTGECISQSSKTPLPDSSSNGHTVLNAQPTKSENNKQENELTLDEITPDKVTPSKIAEELISPSPQTEKLRSFQIVDVPEKRDSASKEEAHKPETKPVRSLLFDNDLKGDAASVEIAKMGVQKKSKAKSNKASSPVVGNSKTVKKQERKNTALTSSEVDKGSYQGSPRNSRECNGRNRVKGRVKEFVKMFNQDTQSKPKDGLSFRSRSCKWNEKYSFEDETRISTARTDEKLQVHEVNDNLKQSTKVNASGGEGKPVPRTDFSKAAVEETDGSFHERFQIRELPQDESENLDAAIYNQEIQDIDAKIRQWTKGKEGNIRSLLSTLQYVLWPESGWKPVPLVDIIEGNAVKRSYQRALLCLHPDKLQQKGAASHQKYIAEKVFDILQGAWNYFNSLGSV
ncbi:DnaJ domain containing protein [Parasponia andersonii]|uniref:DnaJ domain containing protein n=1 Tax=Parasponia andersonii TaxID=3476 RepID=A0A2P5AV89_PARAD|nr:DnaJ domain containing protein [Parasponia andersonii]